MRLVQNDRQSLIDYEIVHSVPEIVLEKATLNVGPEGFNSNQLFEIFPFVSLALSAPCHKKEIALTDTKEQGARRAR